MIEAINHFAAGWFAWQAAMLWQVGVLIGIVAAVDWAIRRWAWPQVRYALWLLVFVKVVVPPTVALSTSLTARVAAMVEARVRVEVVDRDDAGEAVDAAPVMEGAGEDADGELRAPVMARESADGGALRVEAVRPVEVASVPAASPAKPAVAASAETAGGPVAQTAVENDVVGARLSWKAYLMGVWLAGVVALSGWLVLRLRGFRREHLRGTSALPEGFGELMAGAARQLGLRRRVRVVLTDRVSGPAVFGVFRPVLLMPAERVGELTREELEHVLLHELAHVKRGDLLVHAVGMVLQIAYWFNPLLWVIRRPMQELRELCCDATVARVLRERTGGYRETLLETARRLVAEPAGPGMGLLGLFEDSNRLLDRLKWLERKSWRHRPLRIAAVCLVVCVMAACVLPMANWEAEEQGEAVSVERVSDLVRRWYEGNLEAEDVVFDDTEQKARYMELQREWRQGGTLIWGSIRRPMGLPIVAKVIEGANGRHTAAILLPTDDGYATYHLTVVRTGKRLKLDLGMEKVLRQSEAARNMSQLEYTKWLIEEMVGEWKEAQGQELASLVQAIKAQAAAQLAALEYAAENGIVIVGGSNEEYLREELEFEKMSDEEVRAAILEEFEGTKTLEGDEGKSTSAEAAFIVQKVLDRYAAIETYSAVGELLSDVNSPPEARPAILANRPRQQTLKSIFAIKMGRPNLYCIEWNENIGTAISKAGNVWSVGDGSQGLVFGMEKSFEQSLEGLVWTAGAMGRVQSSIFFDTPLNELRKLRDLSQQQDEQLEGLDCYVISGKLHRVDHTFWISKKDFVVRRHKSVSGGEGRPVEQVNTLTDEQIIRVLAAGDAESTPEGIARFRAQLADARETSAKVKVTRTETYRNIILDEFVSREEYVPGGHSETTAKTLESVQRQYNNRLENGSAEEPDVEAIGAALSAAGFDVSMVSMSEDDTIVALELDSSAVSDRRNEDADLIWDLASATVEVAMAKGVRMWPLESRDAGSAAAEFLKQQGALTADKQSSKTIEVSGAETYFTAITKQGGTYLVGAVKSRNRLSPLRETDRPSPSLIWGKYLAVDTDKDSNVSQEVVSVAAAGAVVERWWRAMLLGEDTGALGDLMVFEDDVQKARVLEIVGSRRVPVSLDKLPIVVRVSGGDAGRYKAWTLVPTGAGYAFLKYTLVKAGGLLKLELDVGKALRDEEAARTLTPREFGGRQLEEKVRQWEEARGAELARLAEETREDLRGHLFVQEYADKNGIQGTFVDADMAKHLLGLSDEEMRAELLKEYGRDKGRSEAQGRGACAATLANGITIELLGLCEIPGEGKAWWAADGGPVTDVYWDGAHGREGERARQAVFRIHSDETDPELKPTVRLSVRRNSVGEGSWAGAFFVSKDRKTLENLRGCSFSLHDDHPTAEIEATVGYGSWETQATRKVGPGTELSSIFTNVGTLIFHDPTTEDGKTILSATLLNQVKSSRLVAIDKHGKLHDSSSATSMGTKEADGPEYTIFRAEFSLVLSEIDRFEFQTRTYETVTFKNVSLYAGVRTNVEVVGGDTSAEGQAAVYSPAKVNDPKYVSRITYERPASDLAADAFKDEQPFFGDTVGFAVNYHHDDVVHTIDFDTERIIQIPENLDIRDKEAVRLWARSEGVDAVIRWNGLTAVRMAASNIVNEEWTRLYPHTLEKLDSLSLDSDKAMGALSSGFAYYAFKTSGGRLGVLGLSVLWGSETTPRRLLIKYKLAKPEESALPEGSSKRNAG